MPNLPISGLPVVTVPNRAYTIAAVSASVTSQMTLAQVAAAISSSFTASQAISASYAVSASYEINIETSSSYADTASFVTGSNVYGPFGSNSIVSSSYAVSASYAPAQVSASYALTASYAVSASYAPSSLSSSYALTASFWGGGSSYVPYTGATTNVNLGGNTLYADEVVISPAGYGLLAALSRDISGAGFGSLVLKNGATGYLIPTSSLTVDRTYLLPDKSGTVAMLSDITASVTASYAITASHWLGSSNYTPTAYLSAFHTASLTVPSPNTPNTMSFSTVDFAQGVTISGSWNDKIKVTNGGVYNLQFSAATTKTTGTSATVDIWLRKNESDLSYTNTIVTLAGGANDFAVPAWNFFVSASAGDYYQLMFASPTTNPYIAYAASGSTGVAVQVPSVILTVNRIA